MKCLKIDDGKGYFSLNGSTWTEIDRITKEDLLNLLDLITMQEVIMDEFSDECISQPAHKIIYRNLYQKLSEFSKNKTVFIEESESLYKSALEKYSSLWSK